MLWETAHPGIDARGKNREIRGIGGEKGDGRIRNVVYEVFARGNETETGGSTRGGVIQGISAGVKVNGGFGQIIGLFKRGQTGSRTQ